MAVNWLGANWMALVALVIAAISFVQGQRDRRRTQRQLQEEHARRVTVDVDTDWVRDAPGIHSLRSWKLNVRNRGDVSVHVDGLELVWMYSWPEILARGWSGNHTELVDEIGVDGFELLPGESWTYAHDIHAQVGEDEQGAGSPDFAVLTFRDESGIQWERRSDTFELRRAKRGISWWQKCVQWLAQRVPGFRTILVAPMERRAIKAARKGGPDHTPLSLRYCRWVWGYWAAGERDEWFKPSGAPALWGYTELGPPDSP